MIRWKPLAAVAALTLVAASLGPAVSAQTPRPKPAARNTTPYPAMVRSNFMAGCTKDGTLTEALCACVYRNIERELTLEEFMVMDKEAETNPNAPLSETMKGIALACYADNSY